MNLLKYKTIYFLISLLIILPGLYSLGRYGLKLSIDFTGGALLEVHNSRVKLPNDQDNLIKIYKNNKIDLVQVQQTESGSVLLKSKHVDAKVKEEIMGDLRSTYGPTSEVRFENVGPVIGRELAFKALQSVLLASLAIVLYIAYAFREVPKPYSPWKFGMSAVIALIHDVLVVVGVFSILGHWFNVEIDALFVTAVLTVIGFSVHDTIVVFDRIRENLRKTAGKVSFEQVTNDSLVQTLGRSLNTSLTVLLVLLSLILFGGETIRWFVVALFVGILSGTYSSIFNAAPLLVIWEMLPSKRK